MPTLPALLAWVAVANADPADSGALSIAGRVEVSPRLLKRGALWVSACGNTVAPDESLSFTLTTTTSPCVIEAWVQLPDRQVAMGMDEYVGLGPPNGPLGPEIVDLVLVGPRTRDITDLTEEAAGRGRSVATLEAICTAKDRACLEPLLRAWRSQYNWTLEMLARSVEPGWSPLWVDSAVAD
jgi:hypothetical protein